MKFTDHIDVSSYDGQCLLTLRDQALHRVLYDFFADLGYVVGHASAISDDEDIAADAAVRYYLIFASDVPHESVHRQLQAIGAEGIERIARKGFDFHVRRST
jgi:hypothetical protein